ncbi:MAG TPA: zf-HC2 domain-containing protein, partial [Pyrinomonadaceae bacterium]|nr:zf-HC2 domain-containing protein [Pyrinomonadaceae bacterium]
MTEHPTKQELDQYSRRVLSPDAFLSVHRHITTCPLCATECNAPQDFARDLDELHAALLPATDDTPYHLSANEVAAYARGTLDEIDREIAESHLDVCAACLREVERHKTGLVVPVETKGGRHAGLSLMNRWQVWRVAAVLSAGVVLSLLMLWMLRIKPARQTNSSANASGPHSSPAVVQASPDNAQLALVLNDGDGKVTVDKQGTLAGLERLPLRIQQDIRAALQSGRLEQSPDLAQVATPGNGLPFGLIAPLGQVVRSEQPAFRWQPLAGAQSYTVIVTDADLNEVATSPPLNTTEWRITKPLRCGSVYSWKVIALKDGVRITSPVMPAPQAKFKVLDRFASGALQHAENAYPNSHLMRGVLYAKAGLLDEAER